VPLLPQISRKEYYPTFEDYPTREAVRGFAEAETHAMRRVKQRDTIPSLRYRKTEVTFAISQDDMEVFGEARSIT
jgi:hypothetical protein